MIVAATAAVEAVAATAAAGGARGTPINWPPTTNVVRSRAVWLMAVIPDKGILVNVSPSISVSTETAINGTYMNTKDAA